MPISLANFLENGINSSFLSCLLGGVKTRLRARPEHVLHLFVYFHASLTHFILNEVCRKQKRKVAREWLIPHSRYFGLLSSVTTQFNMTGQNEKWEGS